MEKLGIDKTLSDEEILAALEKKQMEYLDRLDSVIDEDRKKELKKDLEMIESTINTLSWSVKRRDSGIARDEADTGLERTDEEYISYGDKQIKVADHSEIDRQMREKQRPTEKPKSVFRLIGRFIKNFFMCTMIAVEGGIFVVPIIGLITGNAVIGVTIVLVIDLIASIILTKDEVEL